MADIKHVRAVLSGYVESPRHPATSLYLAAATGIGTRSIGCAERNVFFQSETEMLRILQQRDERLEYLITRIDARLDKLEKQLEASHISVRIVNVTDMPPEETKRAVLDYYKTHENAFPDEAADALSLDLRSVMNAVGELMEEGKLEESGV